MICREQLKMKWFKLHLKVEVTWNGRLKTFSCLNNCQICVRQLLSRCTHIHTFNINKYFLRAWNMHDNFCLPRLKKTFVDLRAALFNCRVGREWCEAEWFLKAFFYITQLSCQAAVHENKLFFHISCLPTPTRTRNFTNLFQCLCTRCLAASLGLKQSESQSQINGGKRFKTHG